MNFSFVCVEKNSLDCSTYGHIPQCFLHGLMPLICLFWWCFVFGSAARQSLFLRLGGCLYAIMGGSGNISFAFWSFTIPKTLKRNWLAQSQITSEEDYICLVSSPQN